MSQLVHDTTQKGLSPQESGYGENSTIPLATTGSRSSLFLHIPPHKRAWSEVPPLYTKTEDHGEKDRKLVNKCKAKFLTRELRLLFACPVILAPKVERGFGTQGHP